MPIFVADHQNKISVRSGFLRPVHTGAALVPPNERGPETDLGVPNSISAQEAYADLRLHHYVRHVMRGLDDPIAIFQYRRVFYIESEPFPENNKTVILVRNRLTRPRDPYLNRLPLNHQLPYFNYLATLDDGVLKKALADTDFVVNKLRVKHSIKRHFINVHLALSLNNEDEELYETFWHDLEASLVRLLGKEPVAKAFGRKFGYFHNMMITSGREFSAYCDFLFDLFDDLSAYRSHKRLFGYAAERVFLPYLMKRRSRVQNTVVGMFK